MKVFISSMQLWSSFLEMQNRDQLELLGPDASIEYTNNNVLGWDNCLFREESDTCKEKSSIKSREYPYN